MSKLLSGDDVVQIFEDYRSYVRKNKEDDVFLYDISHALYANIKQMEQDDMMGTGYVDMGDFHKTLRQCGDHPIESATWYLLHCVPFFWEWYNKR